MVHAPSLPDPVADPDADDLCAWVGDHDQAAFARLAGRHGGAVLAACRRILGPGQAADDAAQAVFILLAQKAAAVRDPARLPGWLHRTAVTACRQVVRSEAARRRREERAMRDAPTTVAPPADDEWEAVRPRLDEALESLPRGKREVLVRHFLEGEDLGRVAGVLGISPDAARMRRNEGLAMLRRWFARRGIAVGALAALFGRQSLAAEVSAPLAPVLAAPGTASPAALAIAQGVTTAMFVKTVTATACAALLVIFSGLAAWRLAAAVDCGTTAPSPAPSDPPVVADPPAEDVATSWRAWTIPGEAEPYGAFSPDGSHFLWVPKGGFGEKGTEIRAFSLHDGQDHPRFERLLVCSRERERLVAWWCTPVACDPALTHLLVRQIRPGLGAGFHGVAYPSPTAGKGEVPPGFHMHLAPRPGGQQPAAEVVLGRSLSRTDCGQVAVCFGDEVHIPDLSARSETASFGDCGSTLAWVGRRLVSLERDTLQLRTIWPETGPEIDLTPTLTPKPVGAGREPICEAIHWNVIPSWRPVVALVFRQDRGPDGPNRCLVTTHLCDDLSFDQVRSFDLGDEKEVLPDMAMRRLVGLGPPRISEQQQERVVEVVAERVLREARGDETGRQEVAFRDPHVVDLFQPMEIPTVEPAPVVSRRLHLLAARAGRQLVLIDRCREEPTGDQRHRGCLAVINADGTATRLTTRLDPVNLPFAWDGHRDDWTGYDKRRTGGPPLRIVRHHAAAAVWADGVWRLVHLDLPDWPRFQLPPGPVPVRAAPAPDAAVLWTGGPHRALLLLGPAGDAPGWLRVREHGGDPDALREAREGFVLRNKLEATERVGE